jgi:hypothetical protein
LDEGWRAARQDLNIDAAGDFQVWGSSMKQRPLLMAALVLTLGWGAFGSKGNDIGGIIPWSPEAEEVALDIAQANCGQWNKYAVITSVHRMYGDYIAYACWWRPPHSKSKTYWRN